MQFIIDFRAESIKKSLCKIGEVTDFNAANIVYPAISGHPDIFMSKINNTWILAPNAPAAIINLLKKLNINFVFGNLEVEYNYPKTALYNIYNDDEIAIVSKFSDEKILSNINSKQILTVKQGYISCNTARIGDEFITSDLGIKKAIENINKKVHFINPDKIELTDVKHGFIGGTIGQKGDTVFFTGSKNSFYAELLSNICESQNKKIVFLGENEAIDIGGIIIL